MSRFRNALLASAAALLITQSLLFTSHGRVLAQAITSVLVTNTAANPIPVRDVDNGRQPFQGFGYVGLVTPEGIVDIVTVPAGKRLVVESVSAIMYLPTGQTPSLVFLENLAADGSNQILSRHVIALSLQGNYSSGAFAKRTYAGTYAMRMYINPGTRLTIDALSSGTGGTCELFITGYYIDLTSIA